MIVAPTRFSSFEEFLANAREELGEEFASEIQKVDGVGDFAAWLGTEEYGTLQVFLGERVLHVSTWQASGRTALENVRTLAEKALPRMPS